MTSISLATAMALTERSKRTLWRLIAEGAIQRTDDHADGKAMLDLASLQPYFLMPIKPENFALIESADSGGGVGVNAEAQNELALLFLTNNKPEGAIYWLELAAKQGHPDAMHWLGRCYIEGNGVAVNVDMGLMWLSKSAAHGHLISRYQIDGLCALAARSCE